MSSAVNLAHARAALPTVGELSQGLTPRQIVAATGHKDERMISRYDKGRENLEINAINLLSLDDTSRS